MSSFEDRVIQLGYGQLRAQILTAEIAAMRGANEAAQAANPQGRAFMVKDFRDKLLELDQLDVMMRGVA